MPDQTQKRDVVRLFAANMRRLRKAKALTQEQVAERADLHPNYISSVERSERNISLRNIERIAHALDVTMADLLTDKCQDEFDVFPRDPCRGELQMLTSAKENLTFALLLGRAMQEEARRWQDIRDEYARRKKLGDANMPPYLERLEAGLAELARTLASIQPKDEAPN